MSRLTFLLLFIAYTNLSHSQSKPELFKYCTEIGRFDLVFYGEEVSGIYVLLPKKSTGVIWGKIANDTLTGRWLDRDGEGDITLIFNENRSWFRADYRSDDEPEKWYRDSWHGALRPDEEPTFQTNNKSYQCE